jgi:septum site-determining protein MinC
VIEAAAKPQRQLVRLRGRSYVAFVFVPTVPIQDWLQEIDATIARSPGFFAGRPVVVDLSSVDLSQSGISHLLASLQDRNIRVLGVEGVEEARLTPLMPPLLTGGRDTTIAPAAPKKVETRPPTSLLLEQPVRSGQTIIFPEGDVTILGSVGSGAEVVAGGSIHIYGALRGRAMAGVNGHASARIYCQKIEAELLAIDGFYQTADDIDEALRGKPAQAWLQGSSMRITALN